MQTLLLLSVACVMRRCKRVTRGSGLYMISLLSVAQIIEGRLSSDDFLHPSAVDDPSLSQLALAVGSRPLYTPSSDLALRVPIHRVTFLRFASSFGFSRSSTSTRKQKVSCLGSSFSSHSFLCNPSLRPWSTVLLTRSTPPADRWAGLEDPPHHSYR